MVGCSTASSDSTHVFGRFGRTHRWPRSTHLAKHFGKTGWNFVLQSSRRSSRLPSQTSPRPAWPALSSTTTRTNTDTSTSTGTVPTNAATDVRSQVVRFSLSLSCWSFPFHCSFFLGFSCVRVLYAFSSFTLSCHVFCSPSPRRSASKKRTTLQEKTSIVQQTRPLVLRTPQLDPTMPAPVAVGSAAVEGGGGGGGLASLKFA